MKKILFIISTGVILFGCTNKDIEFDDYLYQSIYFPYQMPVRTLILGDEAVGDNTIDRECAFTIGVALGGVYENDRDREVKIAYAPELAEGIINAANGDTLELLPETYYSASFLGVATDIVTIPTGEMSGKTRIDLNDAFFQDPRTTDFHYVIPLIITDAGSDTVLGGIVAPGVDLPDPRNPGDWNTLPKDYTLFGIRYINETHGYYLYRGQRINLTTNDTSVYAKRFLTDNDLTLLETVSLTENNMENAAGMAGEMLLTFNHANQTVVVSQRDSTTADVSGSGVYFSKDDAESEAYNDQKHRTIYLEYTYNDGADDYFVNDSLVFVDTNVRFEEFTITLSGQ
jgi:hypothetical protein